MKCMNGHDYDFKFIRPSMLRKDELYQRKTDISRVDKIVKEFDGDVFNEPKVSLREGVYWIVDGAHTVAAWTKMHKGDDIPIYCKVFKGMTWTDECELFIAQNGISKDPTTKEKLYAAKNAHRPDVESMVNIAEAAGFTVNFELHKKQSQIVAVSALFKGYKKLGDAKYFEMLNAMKEAWGGDPDSLVANMIYGMTALYYQHYGEFKSAELVKSLRRVAPIEIVRNARGVRGGVLKQIIKAYNFKRRNGCIKVD